MIELLDAISVAALAAIGRNLRSRKPGPAPGTPRGPRVRRSPLGAPPPRPAEASRLVRLDLLYAPAVRLDTWAECLAYVETLGPPLRAFREAYPRLPTSTLVEMAAIVADYQWMIARRL